ncbi:hypothetical protein DERP_005873 [Dermatophagoides pteronyssinus]|uniref:Uncharacterized protein n=1 Tax=Dermatophagoides pteronyssinus TaxID=6956 RepID=A0ABQ8J9S6_DERPT|nr:hypothetical protein DERP_005873 [Dermatophagoides pteronyssinus]
MKCKNGKPFQKKIQYCNDDDDDDVKLTLKLLKLNDHCNGSGGYRDNNISLNKYEFIVFFLSKKENHLIMEKVKSQCINFETETIEIINFLSEYLWNRNHVTHTFIFFSFNNFHQ